jgi:hypothetical protein
MMDARSSAVSDNAPAVSKRRRAKVTYSGPRRVTVNSHREFRLRRRAEYLARIPGEPTDRQRSTIESMLQLEWAAIVAEHQGDLVGFREMREHRRLLDRLLGDFERSLVPKAPAKSARSGPSQIAIEDHLAQLGARNDAVVAGASTSASRQQRRVR